MNDRMKRRGFLKIAAGSATLPPWLQNLALAADDLKTADIRSLFESDSEQTLDFAENVFRKCILDKIMPPTPPLTNRWIVPGGSRSAIASIRLDSPPLSVTNML